MITEYRPYASPGVKKINTCPLIFPRRDHVEEDTMTAAMDEDLFDLGRIPTADPIVVGHDTCTGLQRLLELRAQFLVKTGRQVQSDDVRLTQVDVEHVGADGQPTGLGLVASTDLIDHLFAVLPGAMAGKLLEELGNVIVQNRINHAGN